ncbi:MAG: GGDEF domain-containing protein [Campylobacterota bacterium]|nr:GGDEF domain-containing protein [Campylobacterota bacterium]
MQKEDLKSLVTQMYDELLDNIDMQENATKEQVITFLQNSVNTIKNINDNSLDSTEHAKQAFSNTYKEIANKSLSSYKDTNGIFKELASIHQQTVEDCGDMHIDFPSISEKFMSVQTQMSNEVARANKIITDLSTQVKELEQSSKIDPLTKVFNRRALTSYLESLTQKENIPYQLHLLMLDIDDFKAINDTHGHIAGDKILIFIANILKKTLRDGDKVFRYGGEEFVIILNRISPKSCSEIANRILSIIRSNQLIYKGKAINVTISIGGTQYINGDTPDRIISRADTALYQSKKNGKDQMTSAGANNGN